MVTKQGIKIEMTKFEICYFSIESSISTLQRLTTYMRLDVCWDPSGEFDKKL